MSCIFVAGMHRSGTSCLTGTMQAMGIELGQVFEENDHNKKGNRENSRICRTNDILLRLAGGSWDNPATIAEWNDAARSERDSIIHEIKHYAAGNLWGFKDPRAMFSLDFWLEAESDMQFIGTYRHPYRTALSLQKRDGMPIEKGMRLWNAYNIKLLELLKKHQFDLVNFDLRPDDYLDDVIKKLTRLGADTSNTEIARKFFDGSLRNQTDVSIDNFKLPEDIAETYKALSNYYQKSASA